MKPLRRQDASLRAAYEAELAALRMLDMTLDVFDLAAELRAHHALKTPDALHAACAIHYGCDELWTNDNRWSSVATRIRVRIVR